MGAIQRGAYTFEIEYSVSHQNGAVHVYEGGTFKQELPFEFTGDKPNEDEIEKMIDQYYDNLT
ncbi:YbxH family protein [Bacillus sp. Marseille-Q3570]|uniref:YbxH family protein n=1 Tax=Bacillus sp. Marseille-Q3570 TaxID=2963522 RepID=UPI0021B8491A|nr:YbxH family protein [Bacillus sp. Marseille-Q3570]